MPDRPRSGLGGAYTVKPSPCSRRMTRFQLEASAQAPCTSTITGLFPPLQWKAREPAGRAKAAWLDRARTVATARAAAMMRRNLVGRAARARFIGCPFPLTQRRRMLGGFGRTIGETELVECRAARRMDLPSSSAL